MTYHSKKRAVQFTEKKFIKFLIYFIKFEIINRKEMLKFKKPNNVSS